MTCNSDRVPTIAVQNFQTTIGLLLGGGDLIFGLEFQFSVSIKCRVCRCVYRQRSPCNVSNTANFQRRRIFYVAAEASHHVTQARRTLLSLTTWSTLYIAQIGCSLLSLT